MVTVAYIASRQFSFVVGRDGRGKYSFRKGKVHSENFPVPFDPSRKWHDAIYHTKCEAVLVRIVQSSGAV